MKAELTRNDVISVLAYMRSVTADNAMTPARHHVNSANTQTLQQSPSTSGRPALKIRDLVTLAATFQRYDHGKLYDGTLASQEHCSRSSEICGSSRSMPQTTTASKPPLTFARKLSTRGRRNRPKILTTQLTLPSITEERRPNSDVLNNDELRLQRTDELPMCADTTRQRQQETGSVAASITNTCCDKSQRRQAPVCVGGSGTRPGAITYRPLGCVGLQWSHKQHLAANYSIPQQTQRQKKTMRVKIVNSGRKTVTLASCQPIASSSHLLNTGLCRRRMLTPVKLSVQSVVSLPSLPSVVRRPSPCDYDLLDVRQSLCSELLSATPQIRNIM